MNKGQTIFIFGVLLGAAVLGLGLRALFFYASVTHLPTTSDEAVAALMAGAILEGARPLLFWGAPYQFPLESYLMAPFAELLPHDGFGARVVPAVFGVVAVLTFLILEYRAFESRNRLPGILLILMPSAYVVTLQSAYFIPQHTATMFFAAILPLAALWCLHDRDAPRCRIPVGLLSGVALSVHLLSLPVVVAVSMVSVFGNSLKTTGKNSIVFVLSFFIGFLPYVVTYGEAATYVSTVTGSYSPLVALERLFSPLISQNLKVLLGVRLSHLPDFFESGGAVPGVATVVIIVFWLVMAVALFNAINAFFKRLRETGRLTFVRDDIFVAAAWACIFAYAFSKRGQLGEYRYLLPVAWMFPFVLSSVYAKLNGFMRAPVLLFATGLAAINVYNTGALIQLWSQPSYMAKKAQLPDLKPVVQYLDAVGISHCYASFWFSNRITWETGERIRCTQPKNERFYGWPLPYKKEVDESERAAYVMTNLPFARFSIDKYSSYFDFHRLRADKKWLPPFLIMHDFRYKGVEQTRLLSSSDMRVVSSTESVSGELLVDGDRGTLWRTIDEQARSMHIRIELDEPRMLHRVRVFFVPETLKQMPLYSVDYQREDGAWRPIREAIEPLADRIYMRENHPSFTQDNRQDISFAPVRTKELRIRVADTRSLEPWMFADIQISESAPKTQE